MSTSLIRFQYNSSHAQTSHIKEKIERSCSWADVNFYKDIRVDVAKFEDQVKAKTEVLAAELSKLQEKLNSLGKVSEEEEEQVFAVCRMSTKSLKVKNDKDELETLVFSQLDRLSVNMNKP